MRELSLSYVTEHMQRILEDEAFRFVLDQVHKDIVDKIENTEPDGTDLPLMKVRDAWLELRSLERIRSTISFYANHPEAEANKDNQ